MFFYEHQLLCGTKSEFTDTDTVLRPTAATPERGAGEQVANALVHRQRRAWFDLRKLKNLSAPSDLRVEKFHM